MSTVNVRIDEVLKKEAVKALENLGLDISSAVKMFLKQVVNTGEIPFKAITEKAYVKMLDREVANAIKYGKGYKSAEEMHRAILGDKRYEAWK